MRLTLVALLVACGSSESGPTCEKVVDHVLEVGTKQIGHPQSGELGDRAIQLSKCKERNLPVETRKCLLATKTLSEVADCYLAAARSH